MIHRCQNNAKNKTDAKKAKQWGFLCAELVEALEAAVVAVLLHVLLPLQVVSAVVAVELLSHGAYFIAGRTCEG